MITPCNAENSWGTLTPIGSQTGNGSFAPAPGLQLSQMTNVAPQQGAAAAQSVSAPQSGMNAVFPAMSTETSVTAPAAETIPGQPDPPFLSETAVTATGSGVIPEPILPEAPQFQVPNNPLLPPGYQESINYENLQYLNGFLRTQIGKYMRVEQLVGSNMLEDRYGYLIGVGVNYILLQEQGTGNVSALDYYNIKYVYIYYYTTPSLPAR